MSRDKAIKTCILETSEVVGRLREARVKDSDNLSIIKQLRKEQNKVVLLFTEGVYLSTKVGYMFLEVVHLSNEVVYLSTEIGRYIHNLNNVLYTSTEVV